MQYRDKAKIELKTLLMSSSLEIPLSIMVVADVVFQRQ